MSNIYYSNYFTTSFEYDYNLCNVTSPLPMSVMSNDPNCQYYTMYPCYSVNDYNNLFIEDSTFIPVPNKLLSDKNVLQYDLQREVIVDLNKNVVLADHTNKDVVPTCDVNGFRKLLNHKNNTSNNALGYTDKTKSYMTDKLANDRMNYNPANQCYCESFNVDTSKQYIKNVEACNSASSLSDVYIPSPCTMPESLRSMYNLFQHLDLATVILGKPKLIPTSGNPGKLTVETVWRAHMKLLFRHIQGKWYLNKCYAQDFNKQNWKSYSDVVKVRFYCQKCSDGWTSMYGQVTFHYYYHLPSSHGQILYHVAGQKCEKCMSFEEPLWYPEEAQKVITNLYYNICQEVYSLTTPNYISSRRYGHPSTSHNHELCQGCSNGTCLLSEKKHTE